MPETSNRKEREKIQHRNEILDAAEEVFAEKGFHRTTVEDIASRAEFAVGTLYKFFPGKEELYQKLIEMRCVQLRDEVLAAMDKHSDPGAIIKSFIDTKIQLFKKYYSFARLYTRERLGDRFTDSDLWWKIAAPLFDEVYTRLEQVFKEGIEQGLFRDDIIPWDMTIALDNLTDGFMFQSLMFPDKLSFESKFETMVRLFFDGVSKNK
ncbi:MAG: TetR/AcrR family transcriptional regulator [Sedimentisphaerales bacterium]|nr:TetR/AcrR family transcriptional regulator [Sedimentisphaerales bacterium]